MLFPLLLLLYVGEGEETQRQHQRHGAREVTRLVAARPVHCNIKYVLRVGIGVGQYEHTITTIAVDRRDRVVLTGGGEHWSHSSGQRSQGPEDPHHRPLLLCAAVRRDHCR